MAVRRGTSTINVLLQAFQLLVMLLTAWGILDRLDSVTNRVDDLIWRVGRIEGRMQEWPTDR